MLKGTIAKHTEWKHIGKCIYCGATDDLRNEHCIPESLGGLHVLEKASCKNCEKITCKFESKYTGNTLLPMRTAWNFKSKRSKSKRPKEFPMEFIKDGKTRTVNVPHEDHLSIIPLIEMGPPKEYDDQYHAKGLAHGQFLINNFNIRTDEQIREFANKYDADQFVTYARFNIDDFLRMIAKIAYCNAVWRYGLVNIAEVYILPAILGTSNDIWTWVGSDGLQVIRKVTKHMKTDHLVAVGLHEPGEIRARVKLFKKSETPEYIVVIGRLTETSAGIYKALGHM